MLEQQIQPNRTTLELDSNKDDVLLTIIAKNPQAVKQLVKIIEANEEKYGEVNLIHNQYIQMTPSTNQIANLKRDYDKGCLFGIKKITESDNTLYLD